MAQRFQKIVNCLGTELRPDSDQLSNGLISPDTTELPSNEVSPFVIHFIEGSIMMFWAETIKEKDKWVSAFKQVESKEKDDSQTWLSLSEENLFSVSLYKCLMPTLTPEVLD